LLRSHLLSIPAFRNLWLGQAISQIGDAFYYVTFMFMVHKLTGSNAMVGYVGAVEVLPYLLFSPYAGVLADRIDRRKIMLWSDLLSGFVLIMLLVVTLGFGKPPIPVIFVTAFLLSTVRSFFLPTKNATIPAIVPAKHLLAAMSLSMATQNFMQLAGLAVSAGVLAALYQMSPFWFFVCAIGINCLSFFGSAVFIAKLPPVIPEREPGEAERHPLKDFADGISYISKRPVLVTLMVVSMFFSLMVAPFFVIYVAANEAWFGGKPATLAWLEFAFFLGMIGGSISVAKAKVKKPGISFVLGLATVGVGVASLAYSRSFVGFFWWNIVCGLAVPFADIPVKTYLQLTVPDELRGRVNSSLMMLSTGMMPLGMGLAGTMLEIVGLVNGFLIMGIGMGIVAILGLASKSFRTSIMPDEDGAPALGKEPELLSA
jgi:MFS transporter, DHA3 family, macrolide efflux protein